MSTRTLMKSVRRAAVLMMALVLMLMAVPQSAQAAFRIHIPSVSNARVAGFQPFSDVAACEGDPDVFTLWAGQTIDAGTVEVWNSPFGDDGATTIHIRITATGGYMIKETHIDLTNIKPALSAPRPAPGGAPFKDTFSPSVSSFQRNIDIPAGGLEIIVGSGPNATTRETVSVEPGTPLYIIVHVALDGFVDESGILVKGETAYGGDGDTGGDAWWRYITYTPTECGDNGGGEVVCTGETAWAAGPRYVARGNWATYTPYVADATVNLYAGQTKLAGTVTFAESDGLVQITVGLNDGWSFAGASSSLKIQDYAAIPPKKNPAPGLFAYHFDANSNPFDTGYVLSPNTFYGIHADVQYCVSVPAE